MKHINNAFNIYTKHPSYWWGTILASTITIFTTANPLTFIAVSFIVHPIAYYLLYKIIESLE